MVLQSEAPEHADILKGKFVSAIEDEGTDNEMWKYRFVPQGHCDAMKKSLVPDMSVAKQHTTKMLPGLEDAFDFRNCSSDVTQAYVQSSEELQKDIFIDSPKELNLGPGQLVKLLKPLYGPLESVDYCRRTFRSHLIEQLAMKSSVSDAVHFSEHL